MRPASRRRLAALLAPALALATCSRGASPSSPAAAPSVAPRGPDFDRPLASLELPADDAAARLGAFSWEGEVAWTVSRAGTAISRATEKHRVRQLAGGDFEVSAEIDPGTGPASVTSKRVVFARGVTYARGAWAPFRERPMDRGVEARRQRDDSFRIGGDLARLFGPALRATPSGDATVSGRRARRFALSLAGAAVTPSPPPGDLPGGKYDADTQRHVDFLEGRKPLEAQGELLLDEATGVPLAIDLRGAFAQASDPQLRVDVAVTGRVKALGGAVAAVTPPAKALPDDRKPKGVARALEAAGLRKPEAGAEAAPGDEDEAGE